MKKLAKRLLSIALTAAIVISLIPTTIKTTAYAADSGAFGISTPTEMTVEEKQTASNNPFGAKGSYPFPLLVKSELYITYGWSGNSQENGVNYVKSHDATGTTGLPSININGGGNRIGYNKNDVGEDDNAYIAAVVDGFNPGSGKDEYVALLGLNARDNRLELSLTNKQGRAVSNYEYGNRTLNWLTGCKLHQMNGFLSIACGDYDGDGVDSIILYEVGAGNSQVPSLREYTVNKSGSGYQLVKGGIVAGKTDALPYGLLSLLGDASDMDKTEAKNAAKVQMEAADTDKDGYDELVVTISMNDTHYGEKLKHLGTQVFIYDKLSSGWTLTARFSMSKDGVSTDNSRADDRYRMVWGTSTVGNVIASDNSGVIADFPEIVTVGMQDNESKDMHNINVDGNDMLVYSVIHCTGMTEKEAGQKNYQGKYEAVGYGSLYPNKFTINGFYESEDVSPLLQTKCFSYKGAAEAEAVFISGAVFAWKDNAGDGKLEHLYTTPYYDAGTKKADGYDLDNMQVESVAAGNFDGNEDGREQIVSAYLLKKDDNNNDKSNYGFSGLVTIGYYGDGDSDGKTAEDWKYSTSLGGNYIKNKDKAYVALTDFDCDYDSVVVKYEGVDKQWSDPNVMAVLVASPYFHDIGQGGNSSTDYGIDRTTGTSKGESHTLTTNIVAGFEYTSIFETGGGFEATIENNFTWSTNSTRSITYTTNYSNTTEENQVVVYRSPMLVFKYTDVNTSEKIYLAKTLSPATNMISVEEYNAQAESYGLETIDESKLGVPGLPDTYPSTKKQIKTSFGLANENDVLLADTTWANYSSNGLITKGITTEEMKEKSFNYEFDFSFTAYGIIFGAKVGGGAGYGYETTSTVSDGTAIVRSGTVEGVGSGDYDFQWNFATWSTLLNGLSIPVCGYLVQNVTAPPSPAENLTITDVTENSLTLQWESGVRKAEKYDIYRVLEASTDPYLYIGTVSGDGEEFSYQLNGLDSGTSYTFVVRGISGDKESVYSGSVTACTMLPGGSSITINPLDSTYSVAPTDSVTLKTKVATGSGISSLTMVWQTRSSGKGTWSDIAGATKESLTLTDVTQDMDGNQYRLRVKAVTTSANVSYFYSNTATLSVSTTDTKAALSVAGAAGGNGTLNPYDPYTGYATYVVQEPQYEMQTVDVPVPFTVNGVEGQVYQAANTDDDPVYIGEIELDGTTKYYVLTKNDDGTYSAAGDALTVEEKYLTSNGAAFDVPTGESEELTLTIVEGADAMVFDAIAMWAEPNSVQGTEKFKVAWQYEDESIYAAYDEELGDYRVYDKNPLEEEDYSELGKLIYLNDAEHKAVAVGKSGTYMIYDRDPSETVRMYALSVTLEECVTVDEKLHSLARLDPITTPEERQVIVGYETKTTDGTALTLSATLRKASSGRVLTGIGADFVITNQNTGISEIIHKTSDSSGKIGLNWTASAEGLYAIQVSIPGTDTLSSSLTAPQYFYASSRSEDTQYRLRLQVSGSDVANSVTYGDTISLVPECKTGTGDWEKLEIDADSGLSLTAGLQGGTVSTLTGTSYAPSQAGKYTFSLVKTEDTTQTALATATLTVNSFKLTVAPVWEGTIPASYDAVTLQFTDASGREITSLPNDDQEKLRTVLVKTCTYFDETDPKPGIYYVNLEWSDTEKDSIQNKIAYLNNAYSITLSSASFYKVADAAPVRYEVVGGNGSIDATGDQYKHFTSGEQQSQGTPLRFQATPDDGYLVKNWKVNGNVVSADSETYEITAISGGNSQMLTIKSFDTQRDTADGELWVQVEFTNQTSTVTYSAVGEGSLTAKTSQGTAVQSGASLVYGASVVFTAEPKAGYMVKEWTVKVNNGTAETYTWPETGETYCENTLTLSNLAKDSYTVSVEFTQKQTFTVAKPVMVDELGNSVNVGTITMTNANGEAVSVNDELESGKAISYTLEFTDSNFNTVNAWEYSTDNANWTHATDGGLFTYTCCKGSTGTLYVRAVVSVAQAYTLNWKVVENGVEITDADIASLTAKSGDLDLTSGSEYPVNTPVDFTLELADSYYVVDWSNATPAEDGMSATLTLTGNTTVIVTVAHKPTVSWTSSDICQISVKGTVNGSVNDLTSGDYVDPYTTITVIAEPVDSVVIDSINGVNVNPDKSNGSKTATLEVETEDVNVTFVTLAKPIVTFASGSNGSVKVTLTGSDTEIASGDCVDFGSSVTFTAEPAYEYRVGGWYSDEACTEPIEGTTSKQNVYTIESLNADVNVYVAFELNTYTITFDTDGGTEVEPITEVAGRSVTAPADPEKTGYTFVGWDQQIPAIMPEEDMAITARWKINQYTITFDTDGGTTIDPITQDYGTAVTAPEAPTKTGYTFVDWYESEELSGDPYVFTTIPAQDITLYAKWEINQYTITFDTNGGTTIDPITQDYGTSVTAPEPPTRAGYGFGGWYEDETLSETPFVFTEDTTITRDIILYAKWNPQDGTKYTVIHKYENLDGSTYATETEELTGVTDADTEAQAKNVTGFTAGTVTQQKIKGDGSTVIEITYTRNTYTLTFKPDNGEEDIVATVKYGADITAPAGLEKTGYTFAGWDQEIPDTMPAEDVTITAKWQIKQYTITFKDGETTIASITQDYGTEVTAPEDPTKTGYTFVGWDKEIPETMPAEDVTITAKWEAIQYDITVESTEHGSVTAERNNAAMGDTVTLTVVPEADYALDTLTVTDENGDRIPVTNPGDGKYSFTMPASDVSIKAVFAHANHHTELVTAVEATCEQPGHIAYYTCSVCGLWFADEEATQVIEDHDSVMTPLADHTYASAITYPTCTEQGYTTHICSVCGYTYVDAYVEANGHSFGEWTETKAATCTEKGEESRSCAVCGVTETREIAALGHSYENGTCTNCGEKDPNAKPGWKDWFDKIFGDWWGDACDHEYTSVVTAPTCEEQGYTTHTCSKCGDTYKDSYTDALGHAWDEGTVTKEATCTEDGEKTFTCKTCGKTKVEKIDALGHKFEDGVCTVCGEEEASEPENPGNSGWDNFWDWLKGWWN